MWQFCKTAILIVIKKCYMSIREMLNKWKMKINCSEDWLQNKCLHCFVLCCVLFCCFNCFPMLNLVGCSYLLLLCFSLCHVLGKCAFLEPLSGASLQSSHCQMFPCEMSWTGMMSLFGWQASLECPLLVRWAERGWWVCLAGGLLLNVLCLWDELNWDDESVWLAGFSWMSFACEMSWTGMMSLFGWRASLECPLLVRWAELGWWVCLAGGILMNVLCLWDELLSKEEEVICK